MHPDGYPFFVSHKKQKTGAAITSQLLKHGGFNGDLWVKYPPVRNVAFLKGGSLSSIATFDSQ